MDDILTQPISDMEMVKEAEVDVSFVMPCLDEVQTLEECITRAKEALAILSERHGISGEVVISDNGSTDGSQELAKSLGAKVINAPKRGYGAALISGLGGANGKFLVMGDSDCSYDFVDAVPMIEALMQGHDICMGNRLKGEIKPGAMPWKNRYIGNPALSTILQVFFRTHISDAHCGLRALTKECFKRLNLNSTGMEFASEMVLKASLLKCDMVQVPITLWPDKRGRPPHLNPWRDGWRHLRYMLMLCPAWLFFVPSAVCGAIGTVILAALLLNPSSAMVGLGPFSFGNHWVLVAGGLVTISHQVALFGVMATLHGVGEGYRINTPSLQRLAKATRLEYMLVGGGALAAIGLGLFVGVIAEWSQTSFGSLNAVRELAISMTLIIVGAQTFFGGFLASIINEK